MYILLSFTEYTKNFLENITSKASEKDPLFISQLSPDAGLGCHDFHITLVGRLNKKQEKQIYFAMKNLSHFFRFCIMASHFKVCGNGTVKLIIRDNKAIQRIISQIMTYIPNGNAYFHGTHITLGVYRGKNYKEFENVLNDLYDFKIPIQIKGVELDEDASINLPYVSFQCMQSAFHLKPWSHPVVHRL